jgi:hypothetical protein
MRDRHVRRKHKEGTESYTRMYDASDTYLHVGLGLPDFSWCMTPKPEKMYQMDTKCTKWP